MGSHSDPTGALLLGTAAGIFIYFKGFRTFREYKVVEDTPRIAIRSVAMGLAHVRGRAQSTAAIASPIAHTPCCFYQVKIERWKSDSHGGNWEQFRIESSEARFYLQDATGRILVDPSAAEFDLPGSPPRVVDHQKLATVGRGSGASDQDLLQLVEQAGLTQFTSKAEHWLEKKGPLDDPRKEQGRLALMELFHSVPEMARGGGSLPMENIEKLIESSGPLADPEKEQKRQIMLDHLRQLKGQTIQLPQGPMGMASGRYRLREFLILPGEEYNITGTCAENPGAGDSPDRCIMVKGENEKTFLISCKSDTESQSALRKSAFGMVFGGVALTLVCLGLLLAHLGLF